MTFSGIWPYVKLLLMLFCWCVKETVLSEKTRSALLTFLDVAGKWSLVDSYVLVIHIFINLYGVEIIILLWDFKGG